MKLMPLMICEGLLESRCDPWRKQDEMGTGKPALAYINDSALQIKNLLSNSFRLRGWEDDSAELRFKAGVQGGCHLQPTAVYFRWAVLCPANTPRAQPGLAGWLIPVDFLVVALFEAHAWSEDWLTHPRVY